ncbi:DUF6647 family protein [Maritimibacter sp. UBA3975]|uniref:DUF6647 family protein n=1 Tax=Maritimibacter sp. UBA3975 TaxID=1946833 RepID=UPI000C08F645|nr:DUF6647 family protein [Maritimibacter sp. UBA3975]MAM61145.1 hypothetical protein [Maritimibacter sp.]|tara:strand:+ start:7397 stop:7933 length:537 start_codon:yes stop_codon:yes gene_type:complete
MSYLPRVGRWLATLSLCLIAPLTPVSAEDVHPAALTRSDVVGAPLVGMLEDWLDTHVPWPRRGSAPRVELIMPRDANLIGGLPGRGHGDTRGLYDGETGTIYLVQPWSAEDPQDMAVLLHELVHHRQAPHHFYCPAAQEEGAYRAQEAWLANLGLTADINWTAVILEAGCTPRDIHPD